MQESCEHTGRIEEPKSEDEIAEVERSLAAIGEEMSTPDAARDPRRLARLNEDYKKAEARLQQLYEEWERVVAEAANA